MQKIITEKRLKNGKSVFLMQAEISAFVGDVIINPTNPGMSLTYGTGRAILQLEKKIIGHQSGSASPIQTACKNWVRQYGEISAEKPAYTMVDDFPFQAIIHTVVPTYTGQAVDDYGLWPMLRKSLDLADLLEMHSFGIPMIPNWPAAAVANLAIRGVVDYLLTRESDLHSIHFLLEDASAAKVYLQYMENFQN
jgi:O-acetyl-ADP-ribose deacetylase (regulator of RNase III)